jgi:nitric oxide reductase subunit B
MGVYGMLAIALALFSLRNIIKPEHWKEKWVMTGFWGLNIGLMGMIVTTLVPVGLMQASASFERGFWWARSFEFFSQPIVNRLLWLRMLPDTVFIVVGIIPLVAAAIYGYLHLRDTQQAARPVKPLPTAADEPVLAGASGD